MPALQALVKAPQELAPERQFFDFRARGTVSSFLRQLWD
jgi:hypothetical protein